MASYRTVKTGNTSDSTVWSGGVVPADGDTCTVTAGYTLTHDQDWSARTTGNTWIVNGTFSVPATLAVGQYGIKLAANMTFGSAGQFLIGSSGSPLPNTIKFICNCGAYGLACSTLAASALQIYGTSPTYQYCKLTSASLATDTVLKVDTNLTGDIWAAGDSIRVDNINQGNQSTVCTISSISATSITLNAAIGVAKLIGSYVTRVTGNVMFNGNGSNQAIQYAYYQIFMSVVFSGNGNAIVSSYYNTLNNTIFSGNSYALNNIKYFTLNNSIFSGNGETFFYCVYNTLNNTIISGNGQGFSNTSYHSMNNTIISGNGQGLYFCESNTLNNIIISGNGQGLNTCASNTLNNPAFSGNNFGMSNSNGNTIINGTFGSPSINTGSDISGGVENTGYNNQYLSTTKFTNYLNQTPYGNQRNTEWKYNSVPGAIYFNSSVGNGITQTPPAGQPGGITQSLHCVFGSAICALDFDIPIYGYAGVDVNATFYVISAQLPAGMTAGPVVQIVDPSQIYQSAGSILASGAVANNTSWQTITLHYTPTVDGTLFLRTTAQNASGSYDWWYSIPKNITIVTGEY